MTRTKKPANKAAPPVSRLNAYITKETEARMDDARHRLKRQHGLRVSVSHLTEIALLELLKRRDLVAVLESYGASARRDLGD